MPIKLPHPYEICRTMNVANRYQKLSFLSIASLALMVARRLVYATSDAADNSENGHQKIDSSSGTIRDSINNNGIKWRNDKEENALV